MRRIGSFTTLVGAAVALAATAASAQVYPCGGRNAGLRDLLRPGLHTWGALHSVTGVESPCTADCVIEGPPQGSYWATSTLQPSRPANVSADAWEDQWEAASCRYSAGNVRDLDSATAWCEGVPGDGVGEVLALPWTAELYAGGSARPQGRSAAPRAGQLTGLRIWTGLGRSASLFQANGRPRQLRLSAVQVWPVGAAGRTPEYGDAHYDLSVVDLGTAELRDVIGWQEVPLPGVPLEGLFFVALEIRSAYPGSRFHDTCLSGVQLVTNPPAAGR